MSTERMQQLMNESHTGERIGGLTVSDVWWLSFAGETANLGVAIITGADNLGQAVIRAHALGCNPGGAVYGMALPVERLDWIPSDKVNRMLSPDEAKQLAQNMDEKARAER